MANTIDPIERLVQTLELKPHPEGGFYRETYRCTDMIVAGALPPEYGADRSVCTCIYYLLTSDSFSAIHRVKSDEIYHFYAGDGLELSLLFPDGKAETVLVGADITTGQRPQFVIPGGVWQGSRVVAGGKYALIGCTVAPGFDFADFEMGARSELCRDYPAHAEMISALTRA